MVYCVAWGCTNSSNKSLRCHFFKFPSEKTDPTRRKLWIQRCQRGERKWKPSAHAVICSDHFETSAYEKDPIQLERLGYPNARAKLKKDAIPTIFPAKKYRDENDIPDVTRGAYRKRRTAEILRDIFNDEDEATGSQSDLDTRDENTYEATTLNQHDKSFDEMASAADNGMIDMQSKKTQTVDMQTLISKRTRRTQVNIPCQCKSTKQDSIGIQCELVKLPPLCSLSKEEETDLPTTNVSHDINLDHFDKDGDEAAVCEDSENEYIPSDSCSSSTETDTDNDDHDEENDHTGTFLNPLADPSRERQFLVSETSLCKLFEYCSTDSCHMPCLVRLIRVSGVMIVVEGICPMGHTATWKSQSMHGNMAWGNLLCASSIVFSGGSISQITRFFSLLKVPMFNLATFMNIQRSYVVPTCVKVWTEKQTKLLESVGKKPLVLGGDGRCDSPGHSAKYGTYTLMDLEERKILHIELVQSNEVKNSHAMELEGLKRGLEHLEKRGCSIDELVTDRHVSVKKFMRENHPDKTHYFDVWHMTKGVGKKLEAAAKRAGCGLIRSWIKSTTNHMYWVAASCKENKGLKVDKWMSVINHVANKHEGHSEKFVNCEHGPLQEERHWLKEGSKPYKMFRDIVGSAYLLRDLPNLSPVHQTYPLEVFHNVVNHFAPKQTHYFHASMLARMYISALHFNENGEREQATDADGVPRWRMVYPKPKKGESAVVKPIKTQITLGYADELLQTVTERRLAIPSYSEARKDCDKEYLPHIPPPLTKSFKPFMKDQLIQQQKSRFCHQKK